MSHTKRLKHLLLGISLTLAACGGGGEGSTTATTSYSGATTQATVTTTNAKALSVDAYQGGQMGSSLGAIGFREEGGSPAPSAPQLQAIGSILEASLRRTLVPSTPATPTLAGITTSADITGAAGGSFHYSISVDQASGAFSGTMTFTGYRDTPNGASISGSVTFSGTFNQSSQSFSSFTITTTTLAVTQGGKSYTMDGTISLSLSGGSESFAMSTVLHDNVTGRTYWVKDFVFTRNSQGSMTLSGTYYDPNHGYVNITTVTPLQVPASSFDAWPTSGQLLFTGASGSKARLTFTSTGYTVEVDPNGTNNFTLVP